MDKNNVLYSIPTNEYISKKIEENYNFNIDKIILYRNSGGLVYFIETNNDKYVFKIHTIYNMNDEIHKEAYRAKQSFQVIDYLYQNDFPVPRIHKTMENELYATIPMTEGDNIGALFDFVEGKDIEFDDNVKIIAENTAAMHNIMKNYKGELNVLGKDFYIDRMITMLNTYYEDNYKIKELAEFGDFVIKKTEMMPKSFCHGDYGLHNMKINKDKIFVFDFDVASRTHPMFDIALICDTSNFWTFNKKEKLKVTENISRFVEIYSKYCELSQAEIDSYLYFLALRQYEVRASVAHISLYKMGIHFFNENYLNNMHNWMVKFMRHISI